MSYVRHFALSTLALVLVACGTGGPTTAPSTIQPGTPSTTGQPTSAAPTDGVTPVPGASLDPTLSDAGIAARVTITNDARAGRDGTHDIYGVEADGSECSGSFEEPDYLVVAWYDDAPVGQIHRFSIGVQAEDIPEGDGATTDIQDGGVSFDFASDRFVGRQYTGNATEENEGQSTIDVARSGDSLTFDFEGLTWDNISFAGQLICATI